MSTRKITYIAILTSMALVLSYFERILPPPVPIAGVKFGLANIIILIALYILSSKDAFIILMLKVFMVSLLFSGLTGLLFGLIGGTLSFIAMVLTKKAGIFSSIGVSISGAVFFNIGQIIASMILINTITILYYLPVLIISGVISGFITGLVASFTIKYLKQAKININLA